MAYAPESSLVLAAAAYEPAARERLVARYLPLIGSMARVYSTSGAVDRAELMQEGVVGLLRAADRYDATLGTPFWGYASWWVRQAMQQLVAQLRWPSVLSDRALRHLTRVKDAQREQVQKTGRELSTADLADVTGFTAAHIQQLMAIERVPRGLEEPVGGDAGATVGEFVADPGAQDEFEQVIDSLAGETLPDLEKELTDREREIVTGRYGLGCAPQTLRQIADGLGLSAERVRQIEVGALAKLRDCVT
jgi:RNA polymerase sigma factor (sigma-70 family)